MLCFLTRSAVDATIFFIHNVLWFCVIFEKVLFKNRIVENCTNTVGFEYFVTLAGISGWLEYEIPGTYFALVI